MRATALHPPISSLGVLLILMGTISPARAQLSDTEREIAAFVDAHYPEALELLETTVNVNSGTMNLEGVREVGRLFADAFQDAGLSTRWHEGAGWGRAGHLIAEHPGEGPHLLLIGHLDTVFEPDSPFQRFEMRSDSTARGPGIIDMKGGNVIILQALKALAASGVLDDLQITVVLIGDEEKSGRPLEQARGDLIEAAKAADIAIGFEDGDGNPHTAVISRRGWTGWDLTVEGTPAHSSQIFQDAYGAGAIFELSRILNEFYERLSGQEYLTFNPGVIVGGTEASYARDEDAGRAYGKLNVIAEQAVAAGDLRALSPEQRAQAKEAMRKIVSENLPGTRAEITFEDSYPPMAPTDANRRLLELYSDVSQDLGLGPVSAVDPQNAGAADVSFTAEYVEMAIDGLGLMGTGGHTIEETADLRTLSSQTKRAAILMYRISQGALGSIGAN